MVLPSRPAVILAIKGDRAAHTMGDVEMQMAVNGHQVANGRFENFPVDAKTRSSNAPFVSLV